MQIVLVLAAGRLEERVLFGFLVQGLEAEVVGVGFHGLLLLNWFAKFIGLLICISLHYKPVFVNRGIGVSELSATLFAMTLTRITINPAQMNGQPCIRGMRLTVRRVLNALAVYPTRAELFADYPDLEEADIQEALAYSSAMLEDRILTLA